VEDAGEWLMLNAIRMAKNFHTPVGYWVSLPLAEFTRWIRAGNTVIEEENEEIRKAAKNRR
jgi:hypothetical protein